MSEIILSQAEPVVKDVWGIIEEIAEQEKPVFWLQDIHTGDWVEVSKATYDAVHRCCLPFWTMNPRTGDGYECKSFRCKRPRFCHICFAQRVGEEKRQVGQSLDDGESCYILDVPEAERESTKRRLKANGVDFRFYVLPDGKLRFLQDCAAMAEGERTSLDRINWLETLATPEGRRIVKGSLQPKGLISIGGGEGGVNSIGDTESTQPSLPKPKDGEGDGAWVSVPVGHPTIEISQELPHEESEIESALEDIRPLVEEAWFYAHVTTAHLGPDLGTLQSCINTRFAAFRKELGDRGLQLAHEHTRRVWVRSDEVDWTQANSRAIEQGREGYQRERRKGELLEPARQYVYNPNLPDTLPPATPEQLEAVYAAWDARND